LTDYGAGRKLWRAGAIGQTVNNRFFAQFVHSRLDRGQSKLLDEEPTT